MLDRTKVINSQSKNNRNMQTRKVFALLIASILLTSLICYVAFSNPDLSYTTVIQEGSMNTEASYIIFQDSSTYYARDGDTGVVTSSSNFSYLLMWAIEATPLGHLIIIKNSASDYIADTGINISKPVHIRGEGINYGEKSAGRWGTTIKFDSITNASEIFLFEFCQTDWTKHLYFASIEDICLDANRDQNTMSWPLYIHGQVSDLFFEKVWFKYGGYGGIKITSENDEVWNIWFRDCLIENNDGAGIQMRAASGWQDIDRIHIVDCHFYDNWEDISLWGYGRNIHNIIIRGCTSEATDRHGIVLRNVTMVSLIGNHIIDAGQAASNTYDGIQIYDGSRNITIQGNVIGNFDSDTIRYGISVNDTSADITIQGNLIKNCTSGSFYVKGTVSNFNAQGQIGLSNSGVAEASNGDWIAHGLEPAVWLELDLIVVLTIQEEDANYFLQQKSANTTHFEIYLYDAVAAAAETVDKTIKWHAEYKP